MCRCALSIAPTLDQARTIDLMAERVNKKKCSDFEGSEHVTSKAFVLCLKASHSKKGERGKNKKLQWEMKKALRCLRHATPFSYTADQHQGTNIQKKLLSSTSRNLPEKRYRGATLPTLPTCLLHRSRFKTHYSKDGTCSPHQPLITLDFHILLPGNHSALFCCM